MNLLNKLVEARQITNCVIEALYALHAQPPLQPVTTLFLAQI